MGELSRRSLIAAAVTATGTVMLPTLARAEASAGGYRLLIEEGLDAISVHTLIAGRLGKPDSVSRIAKDMLRRPQELRAIADEMGRVRTIVVACPALAAALETMSGRGASRDRRMKTELSRVLPASALELLVFA